ncbi:Spy/CpxP family protein refolding chaperone [Lutimaribacter sp. EGI FJ00015]|uniref:Spy/CpxP family protein refolding chaperone n=1 Tax=Lutimaribacter degradans TaxID=2945989 RepID=A0ACC5ZYY3_9RHOB|nr:Spy/CpxP family protein refolding chaperone [Lutimaribacter sp. EGI FJ00013]MCM2563395.1 Spy/CpxP family protein refolding chaperone [Lutimaribacter sp. EGI FJ00013]MCO0614526.1 Spy/CpxP family protein refolding chaperone [Lutimaribacter sp. EGI FJ00015]MCO0637199.1 Spy/CpxP family protein refolding chaperone [Lutimaribacter sp. EGI FJ00014]
MRKFALTAIAATLAAAPALAEGPRELSAPIVAFTPVIVKNADVLNLTEVQRADLKQWTSTMPAKRKATETEARDARAALRQAIIEGAPQAEREALAQKVGEVETRLVLMRSACTDHWRGVLTEDQFAQMVALYRAK